MGKLLQAGTQNPATRLEMSERAAEGPPPSFWIDLEGALHLDIPAMLREMNLRNTKRNNDEVLSCTLRTLRKESPRSTLVIEE